MDFFKKIELSRHDSTYAGIPIYQVTKKMIQYIQPLQETVKESAISSSFSLKISYLNEQKSTNLQSIVKRTSNENDSQNCQL